MEARSTTSLRTNVKSQLPYRLDLSGTWIDQPYVSCNKEDILVWLENHICLVPMFPRLPGYSVIDGNNITEEGVKKLSGAADKCWEAIMSKDLDKFADGYMESFNAQISMFPKMMAEGVQEYIDKYKSYALAWKMAGAGGGGYLALVCKDKFPDEGIRIKIRRAGE